METLYSIFDIKTRTWSSPQCHESDDALYQFLNVLINTHGSSPAHSNPEDFVLYKIGIFDPDMGQMHVLEEKELLTTFTPLKKRCEICEKDSDNGE